MNKISKKIVALVTMAAFVLTLVPAAAFAADGPVVAANSNVKTDVTTPNQLKLTFELKNASDETVTDGSSLDKVGIKLSAGTDNITAVSLDGQSTEEYLEAVKAGTADAFTVKQDSVMVITFNKAVTGQTLEVTQNSTTNHLKVNNADSSTPRDPGNVTNDASIGASSIVTSSTNSNFNGKNEVEVVQGTTDSLQVQFNVNKTNGQPSLGSLENVVVWATTGAEATSDFTDAISFTTGTEAANGSFVKKVSGENGLVLNGAKITANFNRPGTYYIHAGVGTDANSAVPSTALASVVPFDEVIKVTIKAADSEVTSINVDNAAPSQTATAGTITYEDPNGVTAKAVTATVNGKYTVSGDTGASTVGKTVTITNPYASQGLTVVDSQNKEIPSVTVTNGNKINFNILATSDLPAGEYTLTLSVDNVNYKLTVKVTKDADTIAKTIEAVDTGKTLIASTSDAGASLSDVARFVIKNAAGEALDAVTGQKAQSGNNILVLAAPDNSTATFELGDYDKETKAYPLKLKSGSLIPGEYKVRVALDSNDSADVTFTVERFGKIVDSKIVITDNDDASKTPVTNVYDGHTYTATVKVVDENGLEKTATNIGGMVAGINSGADALDGNITTGDLATAGTFTFKVKDDKSNNDNALIGTVIKFTAFSINDGIDASAEVTVADPANTEGVSLAFDSEAGEAAKYNTVNVTVVNADGDKVDVDSATGKVYATVVDQSNEDANISAKMGAVVDGKGELTLYSDKETTADIRVTVIDKDNIIYANTLTYAFGEQDIPVNTSVVMTIGSNDFVVNNDVVTVKDAAPYVANDRTYVPFRALGEALGAKVEWDQDAQTVTYTTDKTTLVMTIGKTTYTVNGEEKTMDVAPELKNDRTYVPVRFVGEAFGFKVTALYAADGTTASVLFQK